MLGSFENKNEGNKKMGPEGVSFGDFWSFLRQPPPMSKFGLQCEIVVAGH